MKIHLDWREVVQVGFRGGRLMVHPRFRDVVRRCLLGLGLLGWTAWAGEPLDGARLETLRAEVRAHHPSVAAAAARIRAAEAGVQAVRWWEDPLVGMGVRGADADRRHDEGDLAFSVDQPLPRRRLYEARKSVAAAERTVTVAEERSAVLNLEVQVVKAAFELALVDETRRIQTNQVRWLENLVKAARGKLRDPGASAAETLRLEGEFAREQQHLTGAEHRRASLARRLNTLMGRPPESAWPELALPERSLEMPVLGAELDRLARTNPELQAGSGTTAAAVAAADVARQEARPVFSVGADTTVYSGGRFIDTMALVKVTLPWFNRSIYRANIEQAKQKVVAMERDRESLEQRLRAEAMAMHADAENAARQARTLRDDVIPRSEKAAQAIENAWVSSQATLLEVIESRRAALAARQEEREFVAAQLAALETLRGLIPPPAKP